MHTQVLSSEKGVFYVVATPIGNLADISFRAIDTLKQVDIIYAEDTRHSLRLLQHYGIHKPLVSLHAHNTVTRLDTILAQLKEGKSLALISDAGTPLISDPGEMIVQRIRELGGLVSPIPGPCALIAALSVAGLSAVPFVFEGFLPHKKSARLACLRQYIFSDKTVIFYEVPHRIIETLKLIQITFVAEPDRRLVFARELTKQFETIFSGTIAELLHFVENTPMQTKGEMVLLLNKSYNDKASPDFTAACDTLRILADYLPAAKACAVAAKLQGLSKKVLYDLAQEVGIFEKNGDF